MTSREQYIISLMRKDKVDLIENILNHEDRINKLTEKNKELNSKLALSEEIK